ncbi:hypothetical protein XF_0617 [Xylella fastidiosa 9a5c]|uniref:Uncharacterized protein n=1 Tax=Xylella fastidiosa (strain 9a5c) TaxID=160492 RepID=Q9PFP0_XYLFA|nr:hypothetical protein XF_0617 [Xylella fastidiosa 9a5c]
MAECRGFKGVQRFFCEIHRLNPYVQYVCAARVVRCADAVGALKGCKSMTQPTLHFSLMTGITGQVG